MKKFIVSMFIFTLLAPFAPAQAEAVAGSLVKCADFSSVYYLADDGRRYVFPNDKIYFSWYEDFSSVKEISCDDLGNLQLGGTVPYQAGSRLIKIQSVPTVYAVSEGGELRAIASESQAMALYGDDWASLVDDLSDAFFGGYEVGEELEDAEIPQGMILENDAEQYYKVNEAGEAVNYTSLLEDGIGLVTRNFVFDLEEFEERMEIDVERVDFIDQESIDEWMMELWPICIEDEDVVDFDPILEVGEEASEEEGNSEPDSAEAATGTQETEISDQEDQEDAVVTFAIDADEIRFNPSTITVSAGDTVQITYTFLDENIYFGGLDIKSDYFSTVSYRESSGVQSETVEFVAVESFTIKSYWPSSGVRKANMEVVVE
jgi:hypothetical protein